MTVVRTNYEIADALAQYDPTVRMFIDTETTSFDDEQEAFLPYHGHRITLVIIKQLGNPNITTIPLRHRDDVAACVEDLEVAKQLIREWAETLTCIANANFKFDMHMFAVDNIFFPKTIS